MVCFQNNNCQSARDPKLLCKPDFLQEHLLSTDTSLAQVPIRRARSFPSSFCFCLPFQLETVAATGGVNYLRACPFFFPFSVTKYKGSQEGSTRHKHKEKTTNQKHSVSRLADVPYLHARHIKRLLMSRYKTSFYFINTHKVFTRYIVGSTHIACREESRRG